MYLLILLGVSLCFIRSFSILTVVRSRFLFLLYLINSFVVSILPVDRWRPSQVWFISLLILCNGISCMLSVACHQLKLVKDTHNVILILVPSKWLIPFFWSGSSYHILNSRCFIFSFPEFQALIITKIHLNHCKDSPCVFNFSFFYSFDTGVSSWRFYMMVHQGFNSFSKFFIEILF